MSIYGYIGSIISDCYDADGILLDVAYDKDGTIVHTKDTADFPDCSSEITHLLNWCENKATYTGDGNTYVRERYRMDTSAWVNGATAIACAQAIYAYLRVWEYTNDNTYRDMARSLLDGLIAGRKSDGGYEMYVYNAGGDNNKYTGGNSETPLNLFRAAEIDTEYASEYITEALVSCEWLLSIQNNDGSWRTASNDQTKSAMFTAQAVGAIAMGYTYADNADKASYLSAVQNGISFIQTQLLPDNRIKTCREVNSTTEYWRPPTSDQAITVRGLAIAEYYLSDVTDVSGWTTLRHRLLIYLNRCIGTEGSIRNGLETTTLPNDYYGLTDHVYVTSWAIEAYYYSYLADDAVGYETISKNIVKFCKGNLYYGEDSNTYGTIRGAYNVQDDNWDTSALIQDAINEGGSEMIYVGWVMFPILAWMIKYSMESGNNYQTVDYIESSGTQAIDTGISIQDNTEITLMFSRVTPSRQDGILGVRQNNVFGMYFYVSSLKPKQPAIAYGNVNTYISGDYDFNNTNVHEVTIKYAQSGVIFTADGISQNLSYAAVNVTLPIYLFAVNNSGDVDSTRSAAIRLYECQIKQNGNIVRNFVPCYKTSGGEIGLIDTIHDRFYSNVGTGDFSKGSDVN